MEVRPLKFTKMIMTEYQQEVFNSAVNRYNNATDSVKKIMLSKCRLSVGFYGDRLNTVQLSDPKHAEFVAVGKHFLSIYDK